MKKLFTLFAAVLFTVSVFAQSPQKMSYQAVIRNSSGALVTNTNIGMKISILQGSASGAAVYVETQTPTTNANGLASIEIGAGTVVSGDFTTIDWANGPFFIKTETTPGGAAGKKGIDYTIAGTSQLLSVPYALHAKTAENGITAQQASDITANTAKVGITTAQADAIIANTGKDTTGIYHANRTALNAVRGVNTGDQDISGIATNATAISTIQAEQTTQNTAIALNTAKVGITTAQANAIIANTGKDTTGIYHANRTALNAVRGVNTGDQDISGIATAISTIQAEQTTQNTAIALNTAKVGITTAQANAIIANTGKDTTGIYHANRTALNAVRGVNTGDQDLSTLATKTALSDSMAQVRSEIPTGTQTGQMQYWNGTAWVTIAATENEGATLQMISGVPTWKGGTPPTPNVTNPTTGKIWMDRNLGASQVATSSADALAYGDLYQWGRAADGHQIRTSVTTSALSTSDTPGHGKFILSLSSPYDWRNPQNDNLWQGVSGTNNPCPSGYRLPTEAEWVAERTSWNSNNAAGAFASPLKLPVAGGRDGSNGSPGDVGSVGYYWSGTVSGTYARYLSFNSGFANMYGYFRAYGFSVRCLKD